MIIGFIGLGIMGKPMAKNLLRAGYSLKVFDINGAAVDELAQAGAHAASSAADAAAGAEVVMTMLPNSPQVKEVVFGAGVADAMASGSTLIDMSSINPMASREIAAELGGRGISMLDAPVSGGEPKAVDGTLAFMVGGDEAVFDRYKELLGVMGASVVRCGGIGAGNVVKLANQIIVAVNIAALSEALVFGKSAGVSPEAIYSAIRGGLAGSTVMDAKTPMMLAHNFKPGFKIDLHIKDLTNVADTAAELGVNVPLARAVTEMLGALRDDGCGALDHSALALYYEKLSGESLI